MTILWIGDMHLRVSDLPEAGALMDQLIEAIKETKPSIVVLAGDQFDTFGIVRSEILAHWTRFFIEAKKHANQIIALVGNHDMAGADGGVSAMEPFKHYENVTIVDKPYDLGLCWDGTKEVQLPYYFAPFMRDKEAFEAHCRSLPAGSILFCHQSFNGAQFENGFFDPHGADPDCVKHLKAVISGHVHRSQSLLNIWYPGTPRQLSFSDAGEQKGIHRLQMDQNYEKGYWDDFIPLDQPRYHVLETETIGELLEEVKLMQFTYDTFSADLSKCHIKLKAKGSPSEITKFWDEPEVKNLKAKARRVVDALTSLKPITAFVAVAGNTQEEKLEEFIKQRKWRSPADQLARRARECLSN